MPLYANPSDEPVCPIQGKQPDAMVSGWGCGLPCAGGETGYGEGEEAGGYAAAGARAEDKRVREFEGSDSMRVTIEIGEKLLAEWKECRKAEGHPVDDKTQPFALGYLAEMGMHEHIELAKYLESLKIQRAA